MLPEAWGTLGQLFGENSDPHLTFCIDGDMIPISFFATVEIPTSGEEGGSFFVAKPFLLHQVAV